MIQDQLSLNSVVQVNENNTNGWTGCFVQVTEIKTWGVQGYVQIPKGGPAYIRLSWSEIDYIGEAVMVPQANQS